MTKNNVRYLYDHEAEALGLKLNTKQGNRTKARYLISEETWIEIQEKRMRPNPRAFVKTIKKYGKDGEITSVTEKLQSQPIEAPDNFEIIKISTSETTGQQWIQYAPKTVEDLVKEIDFTFIEALVKKHIKPVKVKKIELSVDVQTFDRVVFTDVHIGMTTNKDGFAMYATKWDKQEINKRAQTMVNECLNIKKSNTLYIDDLGDYLDGWDGKTTRKGHDLPQNMNNQEAFDVAVGMKVKMIDGLVNHYQTITMNNICEDNHAGAFGYVVNSAVKTILEVKYDNVTINNHRQFINHYFVGDHCFVICHGKDSKNLKFGFKPQLDSKQIEKVDQYCKHNKIYQKSKHVEFSKGDSHQMILDYTTSDDFDYCSYPAFSPSSEWVQSNFKRGRSGFVFYTIYLKENRKSIDPYWF